MPTDDYLVYRVLLYEGPSGTYCAPRSRFFLTEEGIEQPNADCMLVEPSQYCDEWVTFFYDEGRYRARIGDPSLSLRGYARKFLGKLDLLLCDISSL